MSNLISILKIKNMRIFIYYLLLYSLFFLPFLLINYQFIDDLDRTVTGVYGWTGESGRILTDVLIMFLNFGKGVLDLSPLPQILAIITMSWSSSIFFQLCRLRNLVEGLCVSLIFLNPFFLENFSFKYDAISITLAISLAMLSVFYFYSKYKANNFIALMLSVCVLLLYQPAINITMVLIILFPFIDRKEIKLDAFYFYYALKSFILISVGGLFSTLIVKLFIETNRGKHESQLISLSFEGLKNIYRHFEAYYFNVLDSLSGSALQLFLWFFIFCILVIALRSVFFSFGNKSYKKIFYTLSVVFILLFMSIILSVGILLLLKNPVFPYRVMLGTGAILFSIGLLTSRLIEKKWLKKVFLFLLILTLFPLLSFIYIYTNILSNQERFESQTARAMAQEIQLKEKSNDGLKIYLVPGHIYSTRTQRALWEWPFLYGLIDSRLNNWWITPLLFKDVGMNTSKANIVSYNGSNIYCTGELLYHPTQYDFIYYENAYYISPKNKCKPLLSIQ